MQIGKILITTSGVMSAFKHIISSHILYKYSKAAIENTFPITMRAAVSLTESCKVSKIDPRMSVASAISTYPCRIRVWSTVDRFFGLASRFVSFLIDFVNLDTDAFSGGPLSLSCVNMRLLMLVMTVVSSGVMIW